MRNFQRNQDELMFDFYLFYRFNASAPGRTVINSRLFFIVFRGILNFETAPLTEFQTLIRRCPAICMYSAHTHISCVKAFSYLPS